MQWWELAAFKKKAAKERERIDEELAAWLINSLSLALTVGISTYLWLESYAIYSIRSSNVGLSVVAT